MRWLLALSLILAGSGCLSAWAPSGPWACSDAGTCAGSLTCDDGVCCAPGSTPACPTLPPPGGSCPDGGAPKTLYRDADGDGAGDPSTGRLFCSPPVKERWVEDQRDCDDTDVTVSPFATERCNGLDDDCDGVIDNGTARVPWFVDGDGDGYGVDCGGTCLLACAAPKGYAARAGDCDDKDPERHPGAQERCNNVDDNCNGVIDDPPFVDAETPGSDAGQRFDCDAPGQRGLCAGGGLQCVFDPARKQFSPTCVPRLAPQPERCGDGIDNDCDGYIDNPPGCGGPTSLIATPGTTVLALRLDLPDAGTPTGLPAHCLANDTGARAMAWLNPSWVGSGGNARHVWVLQAPVGLEWDLSGASTALDLDLSLAGFIHPAPGGWGDSTYFANPIVTLCGRAPGEYLRLYPQPSTFNTAINSGFSVTLPLGSPKAGWQTELGPVTLQRQHVTSVEVVVSPQHPTDGGTVTFTLVFAPDAGFVR